MGKSLTQPRRKVLNFLNSRFASCLRRSSQVLAQARAFVTMNICRLADSVDGSGGGCCWTFASCFNPIALKKNINGMLGEYKSRKRKCMDFVENLADAMEKKVKDVTGEKVLCLETDEEVWGQWTDGATGKTYGKPKPVKKGLGLLGRRKDHESPPAAAVKLPAKYNDV